MVMVVGNRVKGDSRVEKAAQSAHEAGYRVTVVGLIHRSVPACDTIGEVPVYRVAPDYAMYGDWRLHHLAEHGDLAPDTAARTARRRLRQLHSRGRHDPFPKIRRIVGSSRRTVSDAYRSKTQPGLYLSALDWLARLPIRGIWRRAWPLIADLELAFGQAMIELVPDLVHVHDRHALPAAETAKRALHNSGHDMVWLYDAHEWLPGVVFTGPKVHKTAWLAAEAELISKADGVVTVSEERAEQLARRHRLKTSPIVVTNSPRSTRLPDPNGRKTLREECSLDPDSPLLVYVGRIDRRRGLDTVVKALRSLPDVHLAVVAPPDPKPRLELTKLAADFGVADRVQILDYVDSASVTWYISTATAGVSPLEHNPAHHQDLATKVLEYLQAGLPVVGSDVRTQARFLTETGVGAVHRAGDSDDCAKAISQVLDDPESFRSAISAELLFENSWERQEKVLEKVWANLLPAPPHPRSTSRRSRRLTIGPVLSAERSSRLMEALRSFSDIDAQVISRTQMVGYPDIRLLVSEGASLGPKLEEYRHIVAEADGVLLEDLGLLCGGLLGSAEDQLHHLLKKLSVAVMLDPIAGIDPDEAIERLPDSWLLTMNPSQRSKISRQGRRTRQAILDTGVRVLSTSPLAMTDLPAGMWLPIVVPIASEAPVHSGPVRVMVAPGARGGQDAHTPKVVQGLAGRELHVTRPESFSSALGLLGETDVLIDNLGHGSYTDLAAQALGSGCVVLSRIVDDAMGFIPDSCPVLNVTPSDVDDVLEDLVSDPERFGKLMSAGIAYAREVHDGRTSAALVTDSLGW